MAFFVLVSCEKDTGELGLDFVVGNKPTIGTKLNMPIVAYNGRYDSVMTKGLSDVLVGGYSDQFFGRPNASFVSHLLLSEVSPDFGTNPVVDSAFLILPYSGYYGDTTKVFRIIIKENTRFLSAEADSLYYSNSVFPGSTVLADTQFIPHPYRTVKYGTMEAATQVQRINIDKQFIQSKIIDGAATQSSYFEDNEEFVKYFKGIVVESDNTPETILLFDPTAAESQLEVYYHNDEDPTEALNFNLVIGNAYMNMYSHDYTSAAFDFDNQDKVNGEATLYCQAMAGVTPRVVLKGLAQYRDSNFLVNRAELVLHVREGSVYNLAPPSIMYLRVDRDSTRPYIYDYIRSQSSVGGTLSTSDLKNRTYTFNITSHVQRILDNRDTTLAPLLLVPNSEGVSPQRAVFNGNQDGFAPIEFNLYFTRTK